MTKAEYMKPENLMNEREGLIAYMKVKLESADWHAVADAAMDIREIEAQLEILEELNEKAQREEEK